MKFARVPFLTLLLLSACQSAAPVHSQTSATSAPASSPASADRVSGWQRDVDVVAAELPRRHKNAFFQCSEAEFHAAAAALRARVPSLSDHQIVVGLMQLVAKIGDAHTMVAMWTLKPPFRRFPIELYNFSDGPVIVAARKSQADLIGCRVIRFGDVPIDDAFSRVSTVMAYENDATYKSNVAQHLPIVEVAHALGLCDSLDRATITVRDPNGAERSVELTPATEGEALASAGVDKSKLPLARQKRDKRNWFQHLPENNALYFCYARCSDEPGASVSSVCGDVLDAIDRHRARRLVVDLRNNGGGNSILIWPLVCGLQWRALRGQRCEVAVLIGRRTFSSAHMNADELKRKLDATLIGEPTGQKPNAYGEVRSFELPHSGIEVRYSTRYWRTTEGDPPSLDPDIRIDLSSTDYFALRDPVLEAALERGLAPKK